MKHAVWSVVLAAAAALADPLRDPAATAALAAAVGEYRADHERAIVEEFVRLLAIPNVAADHASIRANAAHIEQLLARRGFATRLLEAGGAPPAVYGELPAAAGAPTLVVYIHYDGQPADPADWTTPPWDPVLRDGSRQLALAALEPPFDPEWRLYARSASDDKAPIAALVWALDALEALGVRRSVRLKVFLDGEEEAGSPHLGEIIDRHAELLAADLWIFCDGPVHQTGRPQVAFGVRGVTGFELTVYGPARELHSGHYGNWAPNPIAMLAHLIAGMRDSEGHITIAGFDQAVVEPSAAELAAVAALPDVGPRLREELALARTEGGGERLEATLLRPALNLRGIRAGQVGAQARNAIVDRAVASFDVRLVPALTPERVRELVKRHLERSGYHVVDNEPDLATRRMHPRVTRLDWHEDGYPAVRFPLGVPLARALTGLLEEALGEPVLQLPSFGGSLPLAVIGERLEAPIVLLPIANHDNNQHAADENIRLGHLWRAIELYAVLIAELGHRVELP